MNRHQSQPLIRPTANSSASKINTHPVLKTHQEVITNVWKGPIPNPDVIKQYHDIDPAYVNTIFSMAQGHANTDDKAKNRASLANLIIPIIGQIITFLLAISSLIGTVILLFKGIGIVSAIPGAFGFSGIIIEAIKRIEKITTADKHENTTQNK